MSVREPRLILERRQVFVGRIDLTGWTPSCLARYSIAEIERIPIRSDDGWIRLGDLFRIQGSSSEMVEMVGDCSDVDGIGSGMELGTIIVHGNGGDRLGEGLSGGMIVVHGHVGDRAGAGMRRGLIRVHGNAGNAVGGRSLGATQGMSGGFLWVEGNCGDRLAERMRRGTILIEGSAGARGAWSMIAGTIVVRGPIGGDWCERMSRGTVIASHAPQRTPRFSLPHPFQCTFLPLLWRSLQIHGAKVSMRDGTGIVRRSLADQTCGGYGEWLTVSLDGTDVPG